MVRTELSQTQPIVLDSGSLVGVTGPSVSFTPRVGGELRGKLCPHTSVLEVLITRVT
jgi:hypothetical protein